MLQVISNIILIAVLYGAYQHFQDLTDELAHPNQQRIKVTRERRITASLIGAIVGILLAQLYFLFK